MRDYQAEPFASLVGKKRFPYIQTMSRTKCFACGSHKCHARIHTAEMLYDELACYRHVRDLEKFTDSIPELVGVAKMHTSSTRQLVRGEVDDAAWETQKTPEKQGVSS